MMARPINQLPVNDPLIKGSTAKMADVWTTQFSALTQTLIGYLTEYGMLLPQVTTAQRDTIQSPVNGQMIYNTTLNSAQYFKNGTWTSF